MKDWKEKYKQQFHHADGCLFELHEKFNQNNGISSCTCGFDNQLDFIETLLQQEREKARQEVVEEIASAISHQLGEGLHPDNELVRYIQKKYLSKKGEKK